MVDTSTLSPPIAFANSAMALKLVTTWIFLPACSFGASLPQPANKAAIMIPIINKTSFLTIVVLLCEILIAMLS